MNIEHHCRVCGLHSEDPPWEEGIYPTYSICDCCGAEFGLEDITVKSTREYREKWIAEGAKWFNPKLKPDNWNLGTQLNSVPKDFS